MGAAPARPLVAPGCEDRAGVGAEPVFLHDAQPTWGATSFVSPVAVVTPCYVDALGDAPASVPEIRRPDVCDATLGLTLSPGFESVILDFKCAPCVRWCARTVPPAGVALAIRQAAPVDLPPPPGDRDRCPPSWAESCGSDRGPTPQGTSAPAAPETADATGGREYEGCSLVSAVLTPSFPRVARSVVWRHHGGIWHRICCGNEGDDGGADPAHLPPGPANSFSRWSKGSRCWSAGGYTATACSCGAASLG